MSDIEYPEQIEQLRRKLNFPEKQIVVAVRAKFCCEYCGKNLLESVDAYDSWQIDHIIPKNDDPDNENTDNLALSCKTCNFAKRHSVTDVLLTAVFVNKDVASIDYAALRIC